MKLLNNKYAQLFLALVVGITIGAVFYPSQNVTKEVTKELTEQHNKDIETINNKHSKELASIQYELNSVKNEATRYKESISSLTNTYENKIRDLETKTTENTIKTIKPDGTIIEKTFKQSETKEYNQYVSRMTNEFNKKIKAIESKWESEYTKKVSVISKELDVKYQQIYLEQYKKNKKELSIKERKVNERKFNLELGYTRDKRLYLHSTYTLWGPMFVGGHIDGIRNPSDVSLGVGIGISF